MNEGGDTPFSTLEIDMISKKPKEQHLQYAFTLISFFFRTQNLAVSPSGSFPTEAVNAMLLASFTLQKVCSPHEGRTSIRTLLSSTWKVPLASSYPSLLSIFQNRTNICNKCKLQSFFNYNTKSWQDENNIKTRLQTALKISRDYQRIFPLNL